MGITVIRIPKYILGVLGACIIILCVLPVAAQDAPLARILLPIRGETLRGSASIQGSATAPSFARYQVIYASEPDLTNWVVINAAIQPVPNGTLAVWNTRAVPDGKYTLKLQVFSADGSAVESSVDNITLANNATTPTVIAPSAGAVVSSTSVATDSTSQFLPSSISNININLSDVPRAFAKGVTYTLYAFGALFAYLLIKKVIAYLVRRFYRKPIDYGR